MNKIQAIIVADSIDPRGNRITSFLLTIPQIVVKELLRHRMFSFSSSSMRAIPFYKVLKDTKENMFVPIAFQSHHSGMQGTNYLTGKEAEDAKTQWVQSGLKACEEAEKLYNLGVTKQICSRIIEPYNYAKILVTATEFDNFFELRCPKYEYNDELYFRSKKEYMEYAFVNGIPSDYFSRFTTEEWLEISKSGAEIHIQTLAEAMWDAMNESTPKPLSDGQWHIPFGDKMGWQNDNREEFESFAKKHNIASQGELFKIKIATARCARLSYMTFDGKIDYEKDIKLHDQLLESRHASPFEHVCRVLTNEEYENCGKIVPLENMTFEFQKGWVDNFRGYKSYRRILNFS